MKDIDKLRKAQLKIALEIKRICEKHNIKYFLDSGSMLGAVRHKGFIPWDDDIDMGMLAEEYKRFLSIAPDELGDEFFIDNYETNKEYGLMFSKVRLKGTRYIELKGNPNAVHNEIFVDIFPYFNISDNKFIRSINGKFMTIFAHAIHSKSGYRGWKGEGVLKRIKFIPTDIVGKIFTKKRLHKFMSYFCDKYERQATKLVCIKSLGGYSTWHFERDIFEELIEVDFEEYKFMIPKGYDRFLKKAYGDYMQLPPEEKRVTHAILDLDVGDAI